MLKHAWYRLLAARHRALGRHVILGAGDTFLAAAREQLERWAERTGCDVVAGSDGGDPAAGACDTVMAAIVSASMVSVRSCRDRPT